MKKIYMSWNDMQHCVQDLMRQMWQDRWAPDYVVGITRGGLVPATLISQYLDVPMHTLKVSLRDHTDCESNLWMAEDAFGHETYDPMIQSSGQKKILIVDDINDTGATLNWIRADWQASCLPHDERWGEVWGNNVRMAVLVDNASSEFVGRVDYSSLEINKAERDTWIVFPWEDWWRTAAGVDPYLQTR